MKKLTKKEWKRLVTTKIDDVNCGIDELGNKYIGVCCGGEVTRMPYNEENKLWIIRISKEQDKNAQDLSFSLATLKLQTINYRLFQMFAFTGTAVSLMQNMPVTTEYGTMCAIGGTIAVMVPAVLESLTERKIEKINRLSFPGVRKI